jgi:sodium-dependent phosphate cotransporter
MKNFWKIVLVIVLIYLFLLSIKLVGTSAKMLGTGFSERLLQATTKPFVGIFIGILVTSLVQSSSMTTSLTVGLVGVGVLNISSGIFIIMGANIGTTVTNTLVALGQITWRQEFKRAFSAAIVHDIFNVLTVLVLFPLEIAFGYLSKLSLFLTDTFSQYGGVQIGNPVKIIISPAIAFLKKLVFEILFLPRTAGIITLLALALVLLFISLFLLAKILRSIMTGNLKILIDKYLFKTALMSMFLGFVVTATVQSSSITTSLIIPLVGAGILTVEKIFPYTLGANVGTTMTALLASLAMMEHGTAGLTVAFAHLLFNLSGIVFLYPLKRIPIGAAKWIGEKCSKRRILAPLWILAAFFLLPLLIIFVSGR